MKKIAFLVEMSFWVCVNKEFNNVSTTLYDSILRSTIQMAFKVNEK